MEVSFRFAVRSDLGTVRTNNEDSALASPQLLVLADGMGGHAAGEVASTVATRVFAQLAEDGDGGEDVPTRITLAGRSTRSALQQMSDADPVLESMGTTLLAVVSRGGRVTVGHIGDSRVYALRGSSLYQVTTDHTHVQRLVDTGQLTPERARTHPYRAMLLRSLDDQPGGPDLDVISLAIEPGDRLLLCSDGLSDYLTPEQIGELLALDDRDAAAEALIATALEVGTRDNVTVVVADVVAEAPEGQPELAGAVLDGLELSDDASAALRDSLPALASLIVRSDNGAAVGAVEHDDAQEPPAEEVAQTEIVAEAVVQTEHDAETEPDATPEPVSVVEPESAPTTLSAPQEPAAARPAEKQPAAARAHRPEHQSALPAALASALVVIVALAIWLIL